MRYHDLSSLARGESSEVIRARVAACRAVQRERFARSPHAACNAAMTPRDVQNFCRLDGDAADLLKMAMSELNFSARAYDQIIKVARTIADMAGAESIGAVHISEAIQYRSLDRMMWT